MLVPVLVPLAGCGGAAVALDVGSREVRNSSTSGCSVCRTLSSSVRICLIVLSSVRRSGVAFFDGSALSPPPTTAILDFSLMPYADTAGGV